MRNKQSKVGQYIFGIFFCCVALVLTSCEKSDGKRHYTEMTISAPNTMMAQNDPHAFMRGMAMPPMADAPMAGAGPQEKSDISWVVPEGWEQKSASGMRLATFSAGDAGDPIDCSIVSLGGAAGGLEANVVRWMGQINLEVPPENELKEFLQTAEQFQSDGELSITLIDFTLLQESLPANTASMMAAIVATEAKTYFVKAAGSKAAIVDNRTAFKELCKSLKLLHE